MKKTLAGFLIAIIIILLIGVPVGAQDAKSADTLTNTLQIGDKIALASGEEAVYFGKIPEGDRFKVTLGVPKYVPGTTTKIKPNWKYDHNVTSWLADDNLFDATVRDTQVNTTKDGQILSWDPTLLVGGVEVLVLDKEPTLLFQDPINGNYYGNTLEWDYGVCKRHLRVIEGLLQELWIFDKNPEADVQIRSNSIKDLGFRWEVEPYAYDSKGKHLEISADKLVTASEFNRLDITYPIVIDPTESYYPTASDGYMLRQDATYSSARTSSSAEYIFDDYNYAYIGQLYVTSTYTVYRSYVYFDTSGLPDGCNITSATLKLYGNLDYSDTNFDITITSGMPTYPHNPLAYADYQYNLYTSGGGSLSTSSFTTSGYNDIPLSATGLTWINKVGTTKFCLKSSRDINGNSPTGDEYIYFWMYEYGSGYWPYLEVTYTALSVPTVTTQAATGVSMDSATLNGYLSNDGGEACRVKFQYDIDTGAPYAYDTGWLTTNYTTGQSFSNITSGLTSGTPYYYIAVANNTYGQATGSEQTFTTLSSLNPPTNFLAIPRSSTEISLTWTKGYGATQTLVRYKTGNYPTSTTDGTEACNTTKGSDFLEDLEPGTTYYIKSWGYSGGSFSTANTTEVATTFSGTSTNTSPITVPGEPSKGFFDPPTYTGLSNLPFYENFNAIADEANIPRVNFWMIMMWAVAIVLGASFFLVTKQPIFALVGVSLGIGYGYLAGPIPGWMLLIYIIGSGSALYAFSRQGG